MHPLAALYRVDPARRAAEAMLGEGRRRLSELAERLNTLRVEVEAMREVDPALETLRNLNTPEDYEQALRSLGLTPKFFGLCEGS
jgi:molybdopterin-guanine dinucleotide biosynthesis protein A